MWTNNPTSFSYQWQRCNSAGGGCGNIAKAVGQTYTLTSEDVGHTIVVEEIAKNHSGSSPPASSLPTGVITAAPPSVPTPAPPPGAIATTTSVQAAPSAAVTNQPVTLIATATSSSATVRPTGTIAFDNAGTPLPGCASVPVAPTGQSVTVTCPASFAASVVQLTAVFTPSSGSNLGASVSQTARLSVGRDSTATSLDGPHTAAADVPRMYTAIVASPSAGPGPIHPAGAVTFLANGKPIRSCISRALIGGEARCAVTYAARGKYTVAARYGGDANFTGSAAPGQAVRVTPAPAIGPTIGWTFYYTPTYTKVVALLARGASNTTLLVSCNGQGCPFTRRSTPVPRFKRCGAGGKRTCPTHGNVDLTPEFRGDRLGVGTTITVIISRPHWVGKYYRFTVQARHGPRVRIACMAPGRTRPGLGC
jgi:Bacterial Ig-like domain (group 3)